MKHVELLDENCAIARSSGVIGERWVWVILRQAFNGARRFEEFQRGIGLARNVLTERLNWLVDHGILERRPYAEHAARELNEYRLTAKGRALFPVYTALMQWGNEWTDLPAPPVELLHKPCGHRPPSVWCARHVARTSTSTTPSRSSAAVWSRAGAADCGRPVLPGPALLLV
jgi:DNA-binding HxlR family transcriptional regulator